MSTLRVSNLQNNTGTGTISVPTGNNIRGVDSASVYSAGQVVQVIYKRSDNRTTYSSATTGNGTTITDLNITVTPKFASSLLVMQWMINGEVQQDNSFIIHRNGSLITDTSYTGYNSVLGNVRYSGYANAFYDQNEDSTPSNWFIQYAIPAGSTSPVTFAPAIRSTSGTAYTFAFNRTIGGGGGQDAYESMVSTGMLMEVAQ